MILRLTLSGASIEPEAGTDDFQAISIDSLVDRDFY